MSTNPDEMEAMLAPNEGEGGGALASLEDPTQSDEAGLGGGLSALGPGASRALRTMLASSKEARAALQRAREQIVARRYNKALPWFAVAEGLAKPTRTGAFGETLGNLSAAIQGPIKERQALEETKQKELLGVDLQMAGLDQGAAAAQIKLAELQARLKQQAEYSPNDIVVENGVPRYKSRPEARKSPQAYVQPPASTNVTLGAENKFAQTMSEGAAKQYNDQFNAALQAPKHIGSSKRVLEVLDKGAYTGMGAEFKLGVGKALRMVGLDYGGTDIENTEQLASELANSTLGMIKASGLGGGTGFSNADRDFTEKAAGGKINWDQTTLRRIAKLNIKAQQNVMRTWNDSYARIAKFPKNKEWLDQIGYTSFPIPEEEQEAAASPPPPGAAPAAAPPGAAAPPADQAATPYGLAPAAWAVDPADPPPRASPKAEAALRANPGLAKEFLEKYGYLLPEL